MTLLLTGACSTLPFSQTGKTAEKADRLTVPDVVGYTPAQQMQAYNERKKFCASVPMLCKMINDYGVMRDQARAALGIKVDINR